MLRPPGKLYIGLTQPPMIGGVEKRLFFLNWGVALLSVIFFKAFWGLPAALLVHLFLKRISKDEPFLRGMYIAFQYQSDRYEPFPESRPKRGLRPLLCGRGVVG